jgi:predicted ATPase
MALPPLQCGEMGAFYRILGPMELSAAIRYTTLLAQSADNHAAAEICLSQALALARRQQAKGWELRAARSLSRLWQQQGKPEDARQLLAGVYDWFTEGLETPDLQEARALLAALAS